jgi:uncharacterized membrane protein
MAAATTIRYVENIHPLHAVLVAGSLPLFLGALLCDWAYWSTYEIQWSNFASWLIVGGLFFSGCALVFVIVDAFRVASHGRGWLAYAVTLLAAWIFGLFNAFMHARDAWAAMPGGLILSLVATALVIAATGMAFCRWRAGARP